MLDDNPYRIPQADEEPLVKRTRYDSIGGWLILLAIGLTFTIVRVGIELATNHLPVVTEGKLSVLMDPDSPHYIPWFGTFLVFEVLGNLALAAGAFGLLIVMFKKSRRFPSLTITFFVFNLAFVALDYVLAIYVLQLDVQPDAAELQATFRGLAFTVIWTLYLLMSKRVKGTFVR